MAEIQEKGGGGGKGGKKRSKKQSTRIDMTPMVDLGFLLLTFFILTTTFAKPQTMEINMPVKPDKEEEQQAQKASNALTLIADENDQLFWYAGLPDAPAAPGMQLTNYSANGLRKILLEKRSNSNLTVLLKQTDKSIMEIALQCGFNSHSHLSKQFRQLTGITPTAYRAN